MVTLVHDCPPGAVGLPDDLAPYALRDIDRVLRRRLAEAAQGGGFVVLTGRRRTGRTRCAYEALHAVLSGHELVMGVAAAAGPAVYWLGDLDTDPPSQHDVERLLTRGVPAVLVGVLHSATFDRFTGTGGRDRYDGLDLDEFGDQRRMLRPAGEPVRVDAHFIRAERLAAPGPVRLAPDVGATPALEDRADRWRIAGDTAVPAPDVEAMARARLTVPVPAHVWAAAEREAATAEEVLRLGRAAWDRLDEERAERLLRRARDLGHPRAARHLGVLTERQGRLAEAVELYREGSGWQRPDLLRALGRTEEAVAILLERSAGAEPQLVEMLVELGRDEEATAVRRRSPLMGHSLVASLVEQGRDEEAIAVCRESERRVDLGRLLDSLGRAEEAAAVYRDAVVIDGDWFAARSLNPPAARLEALRAGVAAGHNLHGELLGELLSHPGAIDEAVAVYRDSEGFCDDQAPRLAEVLEAQGRAEEAVAVLSESSGETVPALIGLLLRLGRHGAARELFPLARPEELAELPEAGLIADLWIADPADAHLLGELLRLTGRAADEVEAYRAALAAGQDAWYLLVDALRAAGRLDEAVEVWESAIAAGVPDAAAHLADLLWHERRELVQVAAIGRGTLVYRLRRLGRAAEARAVCEAHPEDDDLRRDHAELLHEAGRSAEAVEVYRRAEAAGVGFPKRDLVAALLATGRPEEAIEVWRDELAGRERAGQDSAREVRQTLAELLEADGRGDEAVALWRDAVADRPGGAAYRVLVSLLDGLGRGGEAGEVLAVAWAAGSHAAREAQVARLARVAVPPVSGR
ncbi:tetratricopeptide repeat protein [Dactylosporangium sp. CA-092794]|uniref:tetratricopeptide repeat protein n=1 Tax=Dactylosporangium sp. CA-092794 TaxID=3239929 RepID=UPI003D8ADAF5